MNIEHTITDHAMEPRFHRDDIVDIHKIAA